MVVRCGNFQVDGMDPATGLPLWKTRLDPTPNENWRRVFLQEAETNREELGVYLGARIELLENGTLVFVAPGDSAAAAADGLRDLVTQTNDAIPPGEEEPRRRDELARQ